MYKIIDIETFPRKKQYQWFNAFSDPCYGFTVKMDVTKLVAFSKKTHTSFFINCLYLTFQAINHIEEFRYRVVDGQVRLYDEASLRPAYTVMTDAGIFENVESGNASTYAEFYALAHQAIEQAKHQTKVRDAYNVNNDFNEYYFSCTPWLSLEGMSHPIPAGDVSSCSTPRVFWDKFREENGKIVMMLNLTVSHTFVDGYPLSQAFLAAQKNYDNVEELCAEAGDR